MAKIQEGFTDLKIQNYGASINKNGTPSVYIGFGDKLYWTGYLTENAISKTAEQLYIAGFKGAVPTDLEKEGALEKGKALRVLIGYDDKDKSKQYPKVLFICDPKGGKKKELAPNEIAVLGNIDLRAHMIEAKKKIGEQPSGSNPPQRTQNESQGKDYAPDDMPW